MGARHYDRRHFYERRIGFKSSFETVNLFDFFVASV